MADSKTSTLKLPDLDTNRNLLKELRKSSEEFGKSLNTVFVKAIVDGKRFEDVLKSIGKTLAESVLKSALKPLELSLSSGFEKFFANAFKEINPFGNNLPSAPVDLAGTPAFANGGVFSSGRVRAFADGGVVASPAYFPMAGGAGLMGERGPEAIMPLSRGADGKLGVKSGGGSRPVSVTVNIATPDAESFRRSESQVSAAIARAASRGRRAL